MYDAFAGKNKQEIAVRLLLLLSEDISEHRRQSIVSWLKDYIVSFS